MSCLREVLPMMGNGGRQKNNRDCREMYRICCNGTSTEKGREYRNYLPCTEAYAFCVKSKIEKNEIKREKLPKK